MNSRHSFRSACYVFLIKDDRVLLAQRFNTGYKDGQYSTMAGHLERDETITDCAIRETFEEAKVIISSKDLKLFHLMNRHSDHDYIDFFFSCKRWRGNPVIGEPDRCDKITWFDLNKLPDNTIDYIKQVLKYYKKGIMFSKYGW